VAPKTPLTFYAFALVLGFTWLSTVPPTAGLVGKLFGTRYLATLFGLTLLSHQIGGFFGAWLGGVALASTGSYAWMWYADIALALGGPINLLIEERPQAEDRLPQRPAGGLRSRLRRGRVLQLLGSIRSVRGDFAELNCIERVQKLFREGLGNAAVPDARGDLTLKLEPGHCGEHLLAGLCCRMSRGGAGSGSARLAANCTGHHGPNGSRAGAIPTLTG
jgi:MFS family permease